MPSISKEDKTITWVCEAADEASARVDLQELLDANPGYKPVLVLENADGTQNTITNLSREPIARPSNKVEIPTEDNKT